MARSPKARLTSRFGDFLLWVVGVNPQYIADRSEQRWYHTMGSSVLVVAMFAFIGAAATLSFRYATPSVWIVGGLVWATAVFTIDRGITSYVERYPTFWRRLVTILPRLALAILAAIAVSESMVLLLFDNEIRQQLVLLNAENETVRRNAALANEQANIDQIDNKVKLLTQRRDSTKTAHDQALLQVVCETAGGRPPECANVATTNQVGRGPLVRLVLEPAEKKTGADAAQAQEDYDDYITVSKPSTLTPDQSKACGLTPNEPLPPVQQDRCVITARIDSASAVSDDALSDVVLNRIIAVFQIGAPGSPQRTTSNIVHGLLFALLLLIDLIPLIMKFSRGSTAHDEAFRAANPPPEPSIRKFTTRQYNDPFLGVIAKEAAYEAARKVLPEYYENQARNEFLPTRTRLDHTLKAEPLRHDTDQPLQKDPTSPPKGPHRRRDNLEHQESFTPGVIAVGGNLGREFLLLQSLGNRSQHYAIYRVRDLQSDGATNPDDYVAKIALDGDEDSYAYQGLSREVSAGSKPDHPNIVPALSGVRKDEQLHVAYRIMPFYPSGHLGTWIAQNPKRTLRQILDIADGILAGLQEGHRRNLAHLDIKPENIFISGGRTPTPIVGDWGNGKVMFQFSGTLTLELRGTPDYCAPEQLSRTKDRDQRSFASDLYSFAALLFALIEGDSPRRRAAEEMNIETTDLQAYASFILSDPPMPLLGAGAPSHLRSLLNQWLAFDPQDRFDLNGPHMNDDTVREIQVIPTARTELRELGENLRASLLDQPVEMLRNDVSDTPAIYHFVPEASSDERQTTP